MPDELKDALEGVDVKRLCLGEGDIVLIHVKSIISSESEERLSEQATKLFEPHQVVVLSGGVEVEVLSAEQQMKAVRVLRKELGGMVAEAMIAGVASMQQDVDELRTVDLSAVESKVKGALAS